MTETHPSSGGDIVAGGQQVPVGPRPVFARATDTDRTAAVTAVRAALTNPADPLRRRPATLPPAPLDVDELDITDQLRQRLVRGREHGFALPTGVEVWTEDGDEWNRLVYPDDADRTITRKTRFDDTLFAAVEAVLVFVVIVMLGSVELKGATICNALGHRPMLATHNQLLSGGAIQRHTGTYCRRCLTRVGD